jgi:hypothetical protein
MTILSAELNAADNPLARPTDARLPEPNLLYPVPLEHGDQAHSLPRRKMQPSAADLPSQAEPEDSHVTARKRW